MADRRVGWGAFLQEAKDRTTKAIESRVGYTMVPREQVELHEAVLADNGVLKRNLDLLGYGVLDQMGSSPHEVKAQRRIDSAKQARMAWMWDPMAGSAIDLMNDFVFGKGVPAPTARDPEVQKVIDGAWNDADNVAALTGYQAQVALGTDLGIQSNIYMQIFADGDDGKVKLSMLDHDTVIDAVRDPENRLRVLYYVATYREVTWDFDNDVAKAEIPQQGGKNIRYYAHWKNVEDAEADIAAGLRDADSLPRPPKEKMGEGVIYHVAVNRTTEMVFGVPQMQRSLRWFSAYNDLMSARVDMAKAAAELIMKRKVKGTPSQMQRMAMGMLAGGGEIATPISPTRIGGMPAGTVMENENVTHDKFNLDSGAANAQLDATAIRSQVSAGTRLPQHFLGDQGNANLATATAMELPVTKMVESRQELFEQLFRVFTDIAIRRAVEAGKLQGVLPGEEDEGDSEVTKQDSVNEAGDEKAVNNGMKLDGSPDDAGASPSGGKKTDLGYEFKMPNPMRRLMSDLATSLSTIAKTFDPNGTNIELARTLLTVALGEALEIQDVADAVNRIYPPGYQDPLVKMELETGEAGIAAGQQGSGLQPRGGATLPDDQNGGGTPAPGGEPGSGRRGPYGTKSGATAPEDVTEAFERWMEENPDELQRALAALVETRFADMPRKAKYMSDVRGDGMAQSFAEIVGTVAEQVVDALPALAASNGHV